MYLIVSIILSFSCFKSPTRTAKLSNFSVTFNSTTCPAVKNELAGVFLFDTSMDSMDFSTGQFTYELTTVVNTVLKGGQPPSHNVCQPVSECNVCSACCKSYLKTQSDCDACVQAECK